MKADAHQAHTQSFQQDEYEMIYYGGQIIFGDLREPKVAVLDLGFTTLLTTQVISVDFYSEREKSGKFCSDALISAWGSFKCRKSTTRDLRRYFSFEGRHTQDF